MKFGSLLLVVLVYLFPAISSANQPRSTEVAQAFLADPSITASLASLKADGWKIGEPSATLAYSAWNDEGAEGVFLVSVYYEKGDKPYNRQNGVLTGVATFAMGRVDKLKIVGSAQAASALISIK